MTTQASKLIGVAVLASLLLPLLASAAVGTTQTGIAPANKTLKVGFCGRIDEISTKFTEKAGTVEENLGNKTEERDHKLSQSRDDRDGKRTTFRTDADGKRDAQYAKMMERASTTEQKAAVTAFQSTVEAAVKARRDAIDAAVSAYRAGVDQSIKDRRTAFAAIANTLKNDINAAIGKAKADCAANIDAATVRSTFMTSIKAARDKFQTDRKNVDKVAAKLPTLADARKAAVEKAISDFMTAVEKARADFKAAIGK